MTSTARLDRAFAAISDPTRRALLRCLAQRPYAVGELAQPHRMTLAGVSKHIHVLEAVGLVRRQRRGHFQIVHLQPLLLQAAQAGSCLVHAGHNVFAVGPLQQQRNAARGFDVFGAAP